MHNYQYEILNFTLKYLSKTESKTKNSNILKKKKNTTTTKLYIFQSESERENEKSIGTYLITFENENDEIKATEMSVVNPK